MYFLGTNNNENNKNTSSEPSFSGFDQPTPSSSISFDYNNNNMNNSNESNSGGGGVNNGFLIAIEVIFSLLVLFILAFCFFAGIKRKRRLKRLNENMIENAINQQERRIQLHLQGRCHSTSTVTTLIQYPPPSYSPPDPTNQFSNDAVSRLDHLLLENQICTLRQHHQSDNVMVALPKYSEIYTH